MWVAPPGGSSDKRTRSKLVSPAHLHTLWTRWSLLLCWLHRHQNQHPQIETFSLWTPSLPSSRPDPLMWSRYCWLPRLYRIIQSNKSLLTTQSFCPFCSRGPWCTETCFQPAPFLGTDFCLPGGFFLDSPRPGTFLSALSFFLLLSWSHQVLSLCMCSHIHVGMSVCEGRVKKQAQVIVP